MMKQTTTLFFLLFLAVQASAQVARVGGIVIDKEEETPIIGATVFLQNKTVKKGISTNEQGLFFFDSIPFGDYTLIITSVGFTKIEKPVSISEPRNFLGKQEMVVSVTQLNTMQVEEKEPLAVLKGDTTEYNSSAYKTNQDATTGDLIEKMPGITNKNGTVSAQGEQVKQVLVDGKPYFGQDPKSALSNIPAEVVQKIQVFDDESDESKATGLKDGNTTKTINIITKPEYRNSKFGNVYAGYGTDERYNAGGNYNIFNGDQRISIVGMFNNVNQQNFSSEDLLGVTAGSGKRGWGNRGAISASANSFLVPQQNGIAQTGAGGINFQDTWGKTEFIGSYFYNNTQTNALEQKVQNYFSKSDANQVYQETDSSYTRDDNQKLSIQMKHKFSKKSTLTFRTNGSLQINYGESFTNGLTTFGSSPANNLQRDFNSDLLGYNANSRLFYNYRFKKRGRSFFIMATNQLTGSEGESNLFSVENDFTTFTDTLDQKSRLITKTNSFGGKIRYTEPIGKKGGISFDAEAEKTEGKTDNRANAYSLIEESYSELLPQFSSQFSSENFTQSYSVGYRFFSKKIFSFIRAKYQITDLSTQSVYPGIAQTQNTFQAILPFAMMKYTISKGKQVFLMYRTSTDDPSVNQLQNFLNNSNPLQLQIGNSNLGQNYTHRLMSRYIATNTKKATTFFAMASYSFSNNIISNTSDFYQVDSNVNGVFLEKGRILNSYANLSGYQNLRLFSSYGLPVKKLKSNLNLDGAITYTRTPSLVNGIKILAASTEYEAGLVLSSNISKKIDFTLSGRATLTDITNGGGRGESLFLTQNYKAKVTWTLPKEIILRTQANYQINEGFSETLGLNFIMWNASVAKKIFKSKKGEISVGLYDVLNQNDQLSVMTNNTYVEQLRSRSLQRYALVTFRYTFKQFDKPKEDPMDQFYRRR